MEMEGKTSLHPSLPSNYVTLAHLQQRWLQQKQHEEEQKVKHQQQHQRRNGFIGKNRNDRYLPKTRIDSGTIAVNQRESVCDATIGDGNVDRGITTTESAKSKREKVSPRRKPMVEERGTKEEAKTEEKKELEDSEKGKTEISSEVNEEKKIDDSIVEEIEQKIGDFSISTVNNGNGRGRNGYFRHSQYGRGSFDGRRYGNGNRNGYGYGYGGGNSGGGFQWQRNEVRENSGKKMVWVKKSDNVRNGVLEN